MTNARTAGWLTAFLVSVALGGCATTPHGGLRTSADRLDRDAQVFAQDAWEAPRGYDEDTAYTEDARDFAGQAHEFRLSVDARGADGRDVRARFDALSRSYNTLRDAVQRSGNGNASRDLRPVTQAYLDVEDDMGGARAPNRYSDEDYDGPGSG